MVPIGEKIISLSCGRKNGNCEILLKEACMGAEELGIEAEIIRAMDLDVRPCKGSESCSITVAKGRESRCSIKDDVEWILEKTLVAGGGLIVSAPVYHLTPNGYLKIITERMIPTMYRHPEILKKTRPGAIISVGGGPPERTPLGLTLANIFMQHTRVLVDQIQAGFLGQPRGAMFKADLLARTRELGRNVARAMQAPIEEATYKGEESTVVCPVCHCNVLQVLMMLLTVGGVFMRYIFLT